MPTAASKRTQLRTGKRLGERTGKRLAKPTGKRTGKPLGNRPLALAGCALLSTTVALAATPAQATPARPAAATGTFVALGDSYAAGAGIPALSAGLCLRSDHNYAHRVAEKLAPAAYRDVTCAAAKTGALTARQTDAGIPVNGPQLDAVTPDTSLVTLTIGGNDIGVTDLGFVDVVAVCTALAPTNPLGAPCRDHYGDGLAKRLDATAPRLADGLRRIHAKAPGARVLVVGYPAILPADPVKCLGKVPVTVGDTAYLRSVLGQVNSMVARTAAANGATYVDAFKATEGHDSCSSDRWIEGLLPLAPAVPLHPNARGEQAMGDAVLDTLSALGDAPRRAASTR
ncbi:SGNH/GDSL hydrolase family protein [Streptomyces orinoci]|uniref:SGNH/GDSL hydrolase family protein n=1 Tax=Streptomyces orinoci TaxID=67339 RepID=A0ABV3K179_STRON|nr:SGNH/GDSL hydrolase family protein [Streptomyces orinoci]